MSDYLQKIAKLTPQQRFEMMDHGMNPLNPEHIKSYMQGKVAKSSMQENLDRIKTIVGEDAWKDNLGHGREREGNMPTAGQEYVPTNSYGTGPTNTQDIRENLKRDMDDYVGSVGGTLNGGDLISLNKPQQRMNNNKGQLNEVANAGRQLATNYYNAFIKSLQNPSTQGHLQVYKALKTMLEQEKALQGTNNLATFQQSVNEVANRMYSKLTNQLNG